MTKPRIGVYVCQCGSNIAATVDTEAVARFAEQLDGVVMTRVNKYSCSDPGQATIRQDIEEHDLDRVVIAPTRSNYLIEPVLVIPAVHVGQGQAAGLVLVGGPRHPLHCHRLERPGKRLHHFYG